MAEFTNKTQRKGTYISESAVTSSWITPTFLSFRFNPEAKPFIKGALSHPPTPAEKKSANTSPTSSIFDPTAPTFYPGSAPLYFSPGIDSQVQQHRLDPQDPFINQFNEVGSFHPENHGLCNGFDQSVNYGFNPGFIHPLNSGYMCTPTQIFAAPGTQPIYATAPEHMYEHPGYSGGECSFLFLIAVNANLAPHRQEEEQEGQGQEGMEVCRQWCCSAASKRRYHTVVRLLVSGGS